MEWRAAPAPEAAAGLEAAGYAPWLAAGMARRGVAAPEEAERFLNPSPEQLHDPLALDGVAAAVERLEAARRAGTRVAVVGDYDVDGVAASALLIAVFRARGLEAEAILPRRLSEGYGFQPVHVERARRAGCGLIVTADCGSTAPEAAAAALAEGIEVVVTDHHRPQGTLPAEVIEINPRRGEDGAGGYPCPELSGAGVALQLARAFAERSGGPAPLEALLRVACLGTIADLVPLTGENRVIAACGLAALPETRSPGLQALFRVSRIRPPFTAADVGYRLGPRINAIGRLHEADDALDLLLTRDRGRAAHLAGELERWNRERQAEEATVIEEAGALFAAREPLPPLLVGWSERWHQGVVGVAAGRLARRHGRPAVLLSVDGELATGSGRSVPVVDLFRFLARWRDDLERFGGHSQAVGLSVAAGRLEELAAAWEEAAGSWEERVEREPLSYEFRFAPEEADEALLGQLTRLGPFGTGNPEPRLRVGPLALDGAPRFFGKGHLGARASGPQGGRLDLLGWGWADRLAELEGRFEALGYLELDRYRQRPVLRLVDSRPWETGSGAEPPPTGA